LADKSGSRFAWWAFTMKLLLVEDSHRLRATLARGLKHSGFVVEEAHDGPSGLWAALHLQPDVVLLDLTLPGFDGLELLARLRAQPQYVPVLLMTARDQVEDRLRGFEAGADDYLPKPFDLRELQARARALGRRAGPTAAPVLQVGDLTLDTSRGEVRRGGIELGLRRRERRLLELLIAHAGKIVSRADIESKLYADETDLRSNSIDAAISQLRRHIDVPGQSSRISTMRGEGYRLER
jgi:DNA-binding response OmpR family regulator